MNQKEMARRDRITGWGYAGAFATAAVIATISPDGQKLTNGLMGYLAGGAGATTIAATTNPPPKRSRRRRQSA